MNTRLKPRKCKRRGCPTILTPVVEWQKYCSVRCRSAVANEERSKLVRKARDMEAQQQGVA
jgi:hypothetical protein